MLYVRIELWPNGQREQARVLQELTIINDGSGNPERGNYTVKLSHSTTYRRGFKGWGNIHAPPREEVWRHGTVDNWPRLRSPVALLAAALRACGVGALVGP